MFFQEKVDLGSLVFGVGDAVAAIAKAAPRKGWMIMVVCAKALVCILTRNHVGGTQGVIW